MSAFLLTPLRTALLGLVTDTVELTTGGTEIVGHQSMKRLSSQKWFFNIVFLMYLALKLKSVINQHINRVESFLKAEMK